MERDAILDRDDYRCQVCGLRGESEQLHVHHVRFRSLGGDDLPENLTVLCWHCHEDVHRGVIRVDRYETAPGVWHTFWESRL